MSRMSNRPFTCHESSSQGMARSLHKARQASEGWQDTQTVSFANTGMKHTAIAMADVGTRVVHAGICTLRAQAWSIGTGTHGQATLTTDIPVSSTTLFGGELSKVVVKATSTSSNYKVLADSFVLSGFTRTKPPKGGKQKQARRHPLIVGARLGTGRPAPITPTGVEASGSKRQRTGAPDITPGSLNSGSGSSPNQGASLSPSPEAKRRRMAPTPELRP